jgi:triosephosphate isomerase
MDAKPLIVAAHKLFVGLPEAVYFSQALRDALQTRRLALDVVVCPSAINLAHVAEVLRDSPVAIAAQNVHQEGSGAFTGQVCLEELIGLGVQYVVIGHSEVLAHGHECAETLSEKIRWCVRHAVRPFVCVTHQDAQPEHVSGDAMADVLAKLFKGLRCDESRPAMPVVVYEPPLSSLCETAPGRLCVSRMIRHIREHVTALLGCHAPARPRVLYGGGVTPGNATILSRELDADGFFVGRASTKVSSFLSILDAAHEAMSVSHSVDV